MKKKANRNPANARALARILAVEPRWTAVRSAREAIGLPDRVLLHAGPPLPDPKAPPPPMLNSAVLACLYAGWAAEPAEARAVYHGKPTAVGCRLAIFQFDNIDVEFLEPGPEKSAWRDLLEDKGPGCHHIAFRTRNLTRRHAFLESNGHALLQRGEFDGGHGRYAYYDTVKDLGVMIELLEFDDDKESQ